MGHVNTVYSTMQHNLLHKPNCTAITGLHFLKYEEYTNIHIYGVPAF